jgi:hypothetical protein
MGTLGRQDDSCRNSVTSHVERSRSADPMRSRGAATRVAEPASSHDGTTSSDSIQKLRDTWKVTE